MTPVSPCRVLLAGALILSCALVLPAAGQDPSDAGEKDPEPARATELDPNVRRLQDDLTDRLGARVRIQQGQRGTGKLVIAYNSLDELDGILEHIK